MSRTATVVGAVVAAVTAITVVSVVSVVTVVMTAAPVAAAGLTRKKTADAVLLCNKLYSVLKSFKCGFLSGLHCQELGRNPVISETVYNVINS